MKCLQPNARSKKVFPTLSYPQARDGSGHPARSSAESLKWQSGNLADGRLLSGRQLGDQNKVSPYAPQPRPPVSGEVHSLGAQVLLLSLATAQLSKTLYPLQPSVQHRALLFRRVSSGLLKSHHLMAIYRGTVYRLVPTVLHCPTVTVWVLLRPKAAAILLITLAFLRELITM